MGPELKEAVTFAKWHTTWRSLPLSLVLIRPKIEQMPRVVLFWRALGARYSITS